ncbi:CRISPR-associated protein (Cas_Cas02710) [Desulfurobacterium pacificum]|uniref:CRISPR-associated protein (Cas_Cas02710) n=1 Tax=Desulfurobacterium pacificum TaxID=240166 RepID=A0ABY1NBB9_9BACT|nr:hypothetical protein [Desulfurobacterium pacificum]SMP05157.1 CRISPR-associated protein (Cas_Cas02710) [Desulfurobacterium pacificum]
MALKTGLKQAFISQFGFLFKNWGIALISAGIFLVLSLIAGWFPDGCSMLLNEETRTQGLKLVSTSVVLLLSLVVLGRILYSPLRFDVDADKPRKKKVLIWFLSKPWGTKEEVEQDVRKVSEMANNLNIQDIKEAVNGLKIKNWRMALDAIEYHIPKLERVIVITSQESETYFDLFKDFIKVVFGKTFSVEKFATVDFENGEELIKILDEKLFQFLKCLGYKDREVIVDVTGGQKTISIVGAILTVTNFDREFQYVSTNNYDIKSFNVRLVTDD